MGGGSINAKIATACRGCGRDPASVRLVAVSKTRPAADISAALQAGQTIFGENRVQEAREKIPQVNASHTSQAQWHLIGPLQRNKVKIAVRLFQMIHSIDSLALAQEIHHACLWPIPVLIQVNLGRESQKIGFLPEHLPEALRTMQPLSNIQIQGLMAIPPFLPEPEQTRHYFRKLAQLAQHMNDLNLEGISMAELSMGMSHDFEIAIEEGATFVRIGSALFGSREILPPERH
ncbi:MAG: YggS family pyridoxal phosphate-dependent enzyme [Magnetococcus sp. DMHC-6]